MQLNGDMLTSFLSFWGAEEIEFSQATNKLAYRIIGANKYQFRRVDYQQRTTLLIALMECLKGFGPMMAEFEGAEEMTDAEAGAKLLPLIIGSIATPGLQPLLQELCALAFVDRGEGKFEPLSDPLVAVSVFDEDITLQIPIALTAAQINFASVIDKLKAL